MPWSVHRSAKESYYLLRFFVRPVNRTAGRFTTSKGITPRTTHLITSQANCEKTSTKVNQASKLDTHLITSQASCR